MPIQYFGDVMTIFDPQPWPALSAAAIRRLYERSATPEARALCWELWRLQRAILDTRADLVAIAGLTHRLQMVERLRARLAQLDTEPCVLESQPIEPGAGRREVNRR